MIDTEIRHITLPTDNIFSDLGFEPEEAERLKQASQALIEAKISLMNNVTEWINANNLKQADAAKILGITRPRVSDIVNHKIEKFTLDALFMMINKTGKTIQFSIT
ncbi:helix-turn-helix domain-containing protein [Glaesserella parasuis]|uniref:helix-turn-helix domain-containing protein n=1 Tax=Glaesserella parasuis TaxID=738 RepID=UPI0003ABEBBE|nr:helix-turn-helix transcriptional regulator [Glaesserella parasuis]EQA03686.1 hypothetical protein HPSSW114_0324 [Glaesserella parasuis SW114]MDD2171645.1 helix-turn-helix domain-containing protein [Glaesserella parasuis]MDG6447389.1 helix-turn-helix transcriptional regulator [Glaesserella parasuis]MDO9830624.1 helix-turn-helix transcriptional regulator [Glaesserella parasuis]MDP0119106.1 helix-turn-helix transcriptional regulator [Glaesserella parasuis]